MSDLLEALWSRRLPHSMQSHMARLDQGTYPLSVEAEDGYPSEEKLEEVRLIAWKDARRWLHDEFPRIWASLYYEDSVTVSEDEVAPGCPVLRVRVATGGWSGYEDLIEAVLSHHIMRSYLRETLSGGAYTFFVPHEDT